MIRNRVFLRVYAVLTLFTLLAGDAWRYSITWYGFSAIALAITVVAVLLLVDARDRWRIASLPLPLLGFVGLATLSLTWSQYRGGTALGLFSTLITILAGLALAISFTREQLLAALGTALRIILALSLAFELFVSLVVRHPVLPLWGDYSQYDPEKFPKLLYWSRDLILDGGKIQGIVGNSSLLGFLALLALIVFSLQLAARSVSLVAGSLWMIVAIGVVWMTRSATITLALVALVATLTAVLLMRSATTRRARGAVYGLMVAVVVGIPVVASVFSTQILALLGKSNDLTGRLGIWTDVINAAQQHPVLGWGWVSYWIPWIDPFDHLVFHAGVRQLHAHNAWLDIWLQLGIVGLVVFAALVLSTLLRSWTTAIDRPQRLPSTLAAAPAPYTTTSLLPLLLMVALLVQSSAESRLLVEYGLALLVICAVTTKLPSMAPLESSPRATSSPPTRGEATPRV
jgi:exopolysaccharide production protein ExoQ